MVTLLLKSVVAEGAFTKNRKNQSERPEESLQLFRPSAATL
jgi:hypothetical protein